MMGLMVFSRHMRYMSRSEGSMSAAGHVPPVCSSLVSAGCHPHIQSSVSSRAHGHE